METHSSPPPTINDIVEAFEEHELASILGIKVPSLRNRRSKGNVPPYIRLHGDRVVYPVAGVRRFLESRTVAPNAAPTLIHGRKGGATRRRS